MHLEIYAANLRQGGAVTTAASLIDGMLELIGNEKFEWLEHIELVVSPQVRDSMTNISMPFQINRAFLTVREDRPRQALLRKSKNGVDVRYVVFGPEYLHSRARVNVTGFADGTLIPSWYATQMDMKTSRKKTFRERAQAKVKKRLLSNYDAYTVQTVGMKDSISQKYGSRPIAVLPNVLSVPFFSIESRRHFELPERGKGEIRLFYPAKAYPHKNHKFLAEVCREFQKMFHLPLTFVVTLTTDEYANAIPRDCPEIINVGVVDSAVLPSLYAQTDGLFFPSFNETFSASPLEAAFMRRPIFISDRPFARDILSEVANYFDPSNAAAAARKIGHLIDLEQSGSLQLKEQLDLAERWAQELGDPLLVSAKLLEFLHSCNSL